MKEKRTRKITIRVTDSEALKLKSLMSMMGYRNVSLFIRDQLLKTRVQRRNLRRTEANLSRQIEQLTTEIKRIGVNYNQVVKALNTLAKLRDGRGNAVVTATAIDGNLTDMKLLMESLLTKVMMIGEEIDNV